VEEASVMNNHLHVNKLAPDTFRNAGCLKPDEVTIALSPKDPKAKEYAKLLSDTVVAMRKDGRLKSLLTKYGISDWEN
jgi:polar amino acid transport system substrate-binding protein